MSTNRAPILLVDRDVGGKILGDGIDLPCGMAEVLVPVFSKLPELRLMVFCISDEKNISEVECQYLKNSMYWNFNFLGCF